MRFRSPQQPLPEILAGKINITKASGHYDLCEFLYAPDKNPGELID